MTEPHNPTVNGGNQQKIGQPYHQPTQQQPYGYSPANNGQPYHYQPGQPQPYGYNQKSKIAAGVLGILLGGLGVHQFYLGNITRAIIQIVVTLVTFGFGSLWGFIEGILILTAQPGSQPWGVDANGVPLRN